MKVFLKLYNNHTLVSGNNDKRALIILILLWERWFIQYITLYIYMVNLNYKLIRNCNILIMVYIVYIYLMLGNLIVAIFSKLSDFWMIRFKIQSCILFLIFCQNSIMYYILVVKLRYSIWLQISIISEFEYTLYGYGKNKKKEEKKIKLYINLIRIINNEIGEMWFKFVIDASSWLGEDYFLVQFVYNDSYGCVYFFFLYWSKVVNNSFNIFC